MITEAELDALVDKALADEVAKRKRDLRQEIVDRERRKAFNAHMDHINRPRPDLEVVSPEEQALRNKWAAESLAAQDEKIRRNEERFAKDEAQRAQALKARMARPLPRMQTGGSEGLEIRRR